MSALSVLEMTLNILLIILTALMMIQPSSYITDLLVPSEPQIFGRGPDGHSKVESEDQTFAVGACWLRQDLSVEIRPARSADSLSLLMKSLSTD